jgi:hypothetical protein
MHKDFLFKYKRNNSNVIGFLQGEGGNCEAQTKMILMTLQGLGLNPDNGKKIAVENFDDHLQAVVYDPKTQRVWNLLTGLWQDQRSDLFVPELMIKAHLDGQKVKTAVLEHDLILKSAQSLEPKSGTKLEKMAAGTETAENGDQKYGRKGLFGKVGDFFGGKHGMTSIAVDDIPAEYSWVKDRVTHQCAYKSAIEKMADKQSVCKDLKQQKQQHETEDMLDGAD